MFNNIYDYLFSRRDLNVSIDIIDATFQEIFNMKDEAPETDYEVDVKSDLNYINYEELVGKTFLIKSDEILSGRWTIYTYEGNEK